MIRKLLNFLINEGKVCLDMVPSSPFKDKEVTCGKRIDTLVLKLIVLVASPCMDLFMVLHYLLRILIVYTRKPPVDDASIHSIDDKPYGCERCRVIK
jgi:hypothetical protein